MSGGRSAVDHSEQLLRRTRVRLAALTLVVVTALVIAVGVTTALTASTLMRQSIDHALDEAINETLAMEELFEDGGEHAAPVGESDTFVLLVTSAGQVVGTTTTAVPNGLPDQAALAAAANGDDFRYGAYGDTEMRLLTRSLPASLVKLEDEEDRAPSGALYAQAGFNLTLQNQLERQMILAITIVGLLGVIGAVIVTFFITRRALIPIREAFETERRFVAAASHELQTPTAIIRASAELLQRERLVSPGGSPLVGDIIGETDRMGRLVGDLLALASLEAGAVTLDVRELEVGAWFDDIARRARSMTESQGLRFVSDRPGGSPPLVIRSDRDRLDQIVLVLVDNAVKHSPPGGVVAMNLALDPRANSASVAVRDHGPGIPEQELEHIFEPFARVMGRRLTRGGAGLGLAIARQLSGRLGAELSVASTVGEGATFRLRLPSGRPGPPAG